MLRLKQQWLCSLVWCMGCGVLGAQSYPAVQPIHKLFHVRNLSAADVSLDIKRQDDTPLYKLQCHSAGYTGDADFEYSGDFECRLSSLGHRDDYSTLLTEDVNQDRDWESRGRFFAADLKGRCARIPDFGTSRTFQLRGMNLNLHIVNPKFINGKLRSLELAVNVRPNPNARLAIAKPVPKPLLSNTPSSCKLPEDFVDSAPADSKQ
jgi:hypothetical protein